MTQPSVADLPHTVPDGIISAADLRTAGVTTYAMSTRCRPSGPWQRLLPGVILLSGAEPTRRQRLRAALVYAGQDAVLSGVDAMRAQGVEVPVQEGVLVLAPAGRRVISQAYLTVERTTRPPEPVWSHGLPVAPLVRATLDAARRESDRQRLATLLHAPVRARRCTVAALRAELDAGSQRGSAAVRALLTDEALRVVPVALGLARRLIREAYLPMPAWQFPLHDSTGLPLGVADAWWPHHGLAWELTGEEHSPPGTELPRDEPRLRAAGITVLRTDPSRLHTDPGTVMAEVANALLTAGRTPR